MALELRLRDYLKKHGIKAAFVAERASISVKRIYRILDGTSPMKAQEFEDICTKALQVNPEIFFCKKRLRF